jgi:hypothetical protein
MNYQVNIESLRENFPPDFQVPPLLVDFGNWLQDRRAGSLGYFRLQSDRLDDFYIENGADLHKHFAFFVRDPTGGQIGFWLYENGSTTRPPIVMVGSEGEMAVLSDSLKDFLAQLAEGKTQAPDLDSRDEGEEESAELTKWLSSRTATLSNRGHEGRPNFKQWMEDWSRRQRESIDADSLLVEIAEKLRKHVKPNAKPWETANFDVVLVGAAFRMWHRSFGPKLMPHEEVAHLEGLFRSVRENRAKPMPERGLWLSASVRIGSQGGANLCCNFLNEPKVSDEIIRISASDYRQDLSAFPRSRHWELKWFR